LLAYLLVCSLAYLLACSLAGSDLRSKTLQFQIFKK
jgi:hypothetical protein